MSDDTQSTTEPTPGEPAAELGEGGKKALDAERRAKREAEKRAADLEARLKEIETRDLSDLDRAKREAQEATAAAVEARAEALRFRIAAKYQIADEDAETFLTGADEVSLTRQAERLAALARTGADTAPAPRPDLSQGARSSDVPLNGDPLLRDVKAKLGIS